MRKSKLTETQIVRLYETGGKTTKEIAQQAGVTRHQIWYILRKNNVNLRGKRRTNGYCVNDDFFKTWSPEMAYVLGFILSDGTISGNSFVISQRDKTILERINNVMQSDYPIKRQPNAELHYVRINRKEMVEDLLRLGITENKSRTVDFPDVPDQYLPHFLRGVIDGDGWFHEKGYVMNVTSGSPIFAYKLHDVFHKYGFNTRIKKNSGAYRVWVSGKEDVNRLGRWIYSDCGDLFLERKRKRAVS